MLLAFGWGAKGKEDGEEYESRKTPVLVDTRK
jgi:hypothetical protein